ncbi:MAG: hypothetical protein QM775_25695 [Pirellulales bacterium]
MLTGFDVDDLDTDLILKVDGVRFDVEHDRDTMNRRQMIKKFEKLESCRNDVLWICPTETRVRELAKLAPNAFHWFTTFEQAVSDPHGDVWANRDGEFVALPRCTGVGAPMGREGTQSTQ